MASPGCSPISSGTPRALVALQRKDWAPDVADSAAFFMGTPALAGWLQAHYERAPRP